MIAMVFLVLLVIPVGFALYVRLAPSDPARWHIALATDAPADCTAHKQRGSATAACLSPEPATALLARLDAIALATPRTTRLAGSAEAGRITWITRSRLWGFPDYTTAQTTAQTAAQTGGTRLDLFARLRFGGDDMGVNAARLSDWLDRLTNP